MASTRFKFAAFAVAVFVFVTIYASTTFRAAVRPFFRAKVKTPSILADYRRGRVEKRVKAVILVLTRDSDLALLAATLARFEQVFNSKFHYPYVFLNDKTFGQEFKDRITAVVMGQYLLDKVPPTRNVTFGLIPNEHWSYPPWIDQKKAAMARQKMAEKEVMYGSSESYRHMCRFYSGFFYRHPLLEQYDYYWRLEPGSEFLCHVDYDPFVFMQENNKQYGFVLLMPEIPETVPTLWTTTKNFLREIYPNVTRQNKVQSSVLRFLTSAENQGISDTYVKKLLLDAEDSPGMNESVTWSGCHFWSNFEIASFQFFRSPQYQSYFDYLDRAGGFFYERWGDAPVHSLGAAIFLNVSQFHHFADIGYRHFPYPYNWCPVFEDPQQFNCNCDTFHKFNLAHIGEPEGKCIYDYLVRSEGAT